MMRLLWVGVLVLGSRVAVAGEPSAPSAAAGGDARAFDAIESFQKAVQAVRAAGPGAAPAQRGCGAVDDFKTRADSIPKRPGARSSVDADTWETSRGTVATLVNDLRKACQAKDLKMKDELGRPHTADSLIGDIQDELRELADELNPRALPVAMKSFDSVLRRLWADKKHKHACEDRNQLEHLLPQIPKAPPTGEHGDVWQKSHSTIESSLKDMTEYYCPGKDHNDDQGSFSTGLDNIHEAFYKMVLLLPADRA